MHDKEKINDGTIRTGSNNNSVINEATWKSFTHAITSPPKTSPRVREQVLTC